MAPQAESIQAMRKVAIMAALRQCPLFASLPAEDLESVVAGCSLRNLQKQETLFHEGEKVDGFFVMRSGSVSIFRVTPDGREQIIWVFRPPDSFAEATLASFDAYPANAVALEPSQVIAVHRNPFRDLVRRKPDLALHMLGSMSQHLRHLIQVIQDLKGRQVDTRLAEWFTQQSPAVAAGCPAVIDLAVSKRVLAGHLGTTSETLSRVFARFTKKGLIRVTGPRITVLNGAALRVLARGET
jgi:CRP/FNR family transcriptional regulator